MSLPELEPEFGPEHVMLLPPCHTRDGGIKNEAIRVIAGSSGSMAVCESGCRVQAVVEMLDADFDSGLGTTFCAEALAARCKSRGEVV